jgi:dTDP-4-dehydrorhamnose 3,5-epimerase
VRVTPAELREVLIVEPDVYRDPRGFFLEAFHSERYRSLGIDDTFVQDNHSRSVAGTLRGLHLQVGRPQAKLVRVVVGAIYDVAVDVRVGSPTFGRWIAVELTAANFRQCYVPPGFAHGFAVLSPKPKLNTSAQTSTTPRPRSASPERSGACHPVAGRPPALSDRDLRHPPLNVQTTAFRPTVCGSAAVPFQTA